MALLKFRNLRRFAANLVGRENRRGHRADRRSASSINRCLTIDPLEERQLLSLSPADIDDILVNQTVSDAQNTLGAQSVAVDHDGDFVVTWSRTELVGGQEDTNIWARYFTDEVQRLTLPDAVLENTDGDLGTFGRFSLNYGKEVQRLTVEATYAPFTPEIFQPLISGSFQLGFDVDGNGSIGGGETTTVGSFSELDPVDVNAQKVETALRFLGGALTNVEVMGVSPSEFIIEFPADEGDQPLITVAANDLTSGFLPTVTIDSISEPKEIANIPVSPTNAWLTASAIEAWFHQYTTEAQIGPVDFPPVARATNPAEGPYLLPEVLDVSLPTIAVRPLSVGVNPDGTTDWSETQFDITFTGPSGKQDHPELVVNDVLQDNDVSVGGSPQIDVETLKQPSPEFRVNAPESDDPFTPQIDVYEQSAPAVAMDADGDFVIVWQGEVPNSENFGSVTDIFARRFSPIGYQENPADVVFEDADGNPIQSVRPLGNEFRVNTFTTNRQSQPTVGMDDDGGFVVAWRNQGQDLSYFNGITAQRFNRDGERVGNEFMVNEEDTDEHWDPFVGVSHDGHFAISWTKSDDTAIVPGGVFTGTTWVEVYDSEGNVLWEQFSPIAVGDSSVAWDDDLNFVVTANALVDNDSLGITSGGTRGIMFELYDDSGVAHAAPTVIRDLFRVNGANGDPGATPLWPLFQGDAHVGMDADGDMYVTYEGYGPDVSEIDIDEYVESFLIGWAPFLTTDELAQLRWDVENESAFSPIAWGLLRGEANGVMFSRFDANPQLNDDPIDIGLFSDSVVNNHRDGHNQRVIIELDTVVEGGSFTLRLAHPNVEGFEDITITPVIVNGNVDEVATAEAIDDALEAATRTGINWESPPFGGPINVRIIDDLEIAARQGAVLDDGTAPWDLGVTPGNHVFEVTFQGEVHDWPMILGLVDSSLTAGDFAERQILVIDLDGEPQSGGLALQIDTDGDQIPDDIGTFTFNSDNPAGSVGEIASLLAAAGYPGAQVTLISDTDPFEYEIVFAGNAGENIPPMYVTPVRDPETNEPQLDGNFYFDQERARDGGTGDAPDPNVFDYMYGADGTYQGSASLGVEPDGDLVMAWTSWEELSNGSIANQNIHFRRFNEDTDTAGPLVTDFLLPSGERLASGDEVLQSLQTIVVTFDEEMATSGLHSVTNPENWVLLRDNVEVVGGIHSIEFGMNQAAHMFGTPASNKWEAVITLDGDTTTNVAEALEDGHYQIVALNSIRDRAGNALGRTGYEFNGERYSRTFDILVPADGSEVPVNDLTNDDQYTQPYSPQAVADDADGDYVVVWRSDDAARPGVYAKLYNVDWFNVDGDRQSLVTEMSVVDPTTNTVPIPEKEIRITDDPTATNASVARDIDGDFVVTWSQWSADTDWDVYARRFDAAGNALGTPFLVNAETAENQRYSTVAMDGDGDFVIAWQSEGQDGSGYGVYAKRYSTTGDPLGGVNETQRLNFSGQARWQFQLGDGVNTTSVINYEGNTFNIEDTVEQRLQDDLGLEVEVEAVSFDVLLIRFVGADGSQDVPQLAIENAILVEGEEGAQLTISTAINGAEPDFLVNQTTEQNQRFPSIAMDASGSFVISWTSGGQDGDAPYETNIYARQFVSNDIFRANSLSASGRKLLHYTQQQAGVLPKVIAATNPLSNVVDAGTNLDGVALVSAGGATGSGSLLNTGRHVLTAAHVVVDFFGNVDPDSVSVTFDTDTGAVSYGASEIFVHPEYTGDVLDGNDLAIIVLEQDAAANVPRLEIYRGDDELDQEVTISGYGLYGTGALGELGYDGQKRSGKNEYDALGDVFDGFAQGILLAYDFDSGLEENDAFGAVYDINDLGLGDEEGFAARGDSGGPILIGDQIAGLTSFGWASPDTDVNDFLDSSFGEFQVDTRVSAFADWIDDITSVTAVGSDEFLVNQTTDNVQKNSVVAMDSDGDFVIAWTSYGEDGVGNGPGAGYDGQEGVFAQRFNSLAETVGGQFQVNTFAAGVQQHPRIAMDVDGDFVITWESFQDRPQAPFNEPGLDPDSPNSFGIFAQRYASNDLLGNSPFLGDNGEIGSELQINTTIDGDQRYPGVAMDDTGDFVVAWSGKGLGDDQGIFHRRFEVPSDIAGPQVADVLHVPAGDAPYQVFQRDVIEDDNVTQFVVSFGEDLNEVSQTDYNSVENLQNWRLTHNGQVIFGGIRSVEFGLDEYSNENKYQAVIGFDARPTEAGVQPLEAGTYVLTIQDTVEDIFGNALDGDYNGTPGGNYTLQFTIVVDGDDSDDTDPGDPGDDDDDDPINNVETADQNEPAVARNDTGEYVVVWTTYGVSGDSFAEGNIVAQRFDATGVKLGSEFVVNTYRDGHQSKPDVAMDDFGNFIVTWQGEGEIDDSGVFARRFDASGNPLGEEFRVNEFRKGDQHTARVAMDRDGDAVVTFSSFSFDLPEDHQAVYARQFPVFGDPSDEFRVNQWLPGAQRDSDVAMDDDGNFVVVWNSDNQDENSWSVIGRMYDADLSPRTGEFRVNVYGIDKQVEPVVAMDGDGDFAVAWSSFLQDGSGYGVYARQYNAAGTPVFDSVDGEFRVNETAHDWQRQPAISMDETGKFVVTWTSFGQDNPEDEFLEDDGIFGRIYQADGSDFVGDDLLALGEFRINATTAGDQFDSDVAMDADGDFVTVWVGPDSSGEGIFTRRVGGVGKSLDGNGGGGGPKSDGGGNNPVTGPRLLTGTSGDDVFEFIAGPTAGSWIVKVNGTEYPMQSYHTGVSFDGRGGTDSVLISGSTADESFELYPDEGVFNTPDYRVTFTNVETTLVVGGGGQDAADIYDSENTDQFDSHPDYSRLSGDGFSVRVEGVSEVQAYAENGGQDLARLYGSDQLVDAFLAEPNYGEIVSASYNRGAAGFYYTYGFGNGSDDSAVLVDSAGNDLLVGTPEEVVLSGAGFRNQARGFGSVEGQSTNGGQDTARLTGSAEKDTFTGSYEESMLKGPGFSHLMVGFYAVEVASNGGTGEFASLYDSPWNDSFVGEGRYGEIHAGGHYSIEVTGFEYTRGFAFNGGTDFANLYDTAADDILYAKPEYMRFLNDDYNTVARSFEYSRAFAVNGGTDYSRLYDTAGDDRYVGSPGLARLYGDGYNNAARYFEFNRAIGTEGNDTAKFYDSVEDDVMTAQPGEVVMSGGGVEHMAVNFDSVTGYSLNGGNDEAYLYDSALGDFLAADGDWVTLSNDELGFAYRVFGFDAVNAESTGGDDVKDVDASVDYLLATGAWTDA